MRITTTLFSVLALGTLLAPAALAQDSDIPGFPARDDIVLVPQTQQAFDRTGTRNIEVTLSNGTIISDHNETLQSVTVARLGPDGSVETLCTEDKAQALDFMSGKGIASVPPTRTALLPGDER